MTIKSKVILLIIISASLLALLGCGSSSAPLQVTVDASYSGKTVKIATDGSLAVILESNPTTGYQWELTDISDLTVLKQVDQEFVTSSPEGTTNGPPMTGAPGKEVWTFKAIEKGTSTISMGYGKAWESILPATTFTLIVKVKYNKKKTIESTRHTLN